MTFRQRRLWFVVLAAALLLVSFGVAKFVFRPGIQVTIRNLGRAPIHSVVLHVTGNSYPLGNIAPGESREVAVRATGKSSLTIELADADGKSQRLEAGAFFGAGYRGTILVEIADGAIRQIKRTIEAH